MMKLRLAALVPLLLLAGCASWFSGKPAKEPSQLTEFKPTAQFAVLWKHEVGESRNNVLQPAVVGDVVYAANAKGEVFRFEGKSGRQVWRADGGFSVTGGVGAGEGLVLVGGEKGDLVAFGEDDGKQRWKVKVSSEVLSPPLVADGIVVVRTGDGRIAGLSAADGTRQWLYERSTPALVVRSHAGATVERGVLYAGFAGGKMVALKLGNGALVWEATVSQPRGNTELERISDITSLPVLNDEQVCAVAFQGRLACFDPAQGNLLWSRSLSSDKGMALRGLLIYVTDAEGGVMALYRGSGAVLWKNTQLSVRDTSTPLVSGNNVVVGDFEGYIHAMSRVDGSFTARIQVGGGPIAAAPVALGDDILVQTLSGGLYALTLR